MNVEQFEESRRVSMALARKVCCCEPVGGWRLCMRRPGHGGSCLPFPADYTPRAVAA